jgi:murein DD-endopeptidase MepM/ murein hydrolase activator NlpD
MAISTLSSPLSSVANKIISVNSKSGTSLVKTQSEYKKFGEFLNAKKLELERTQLPDDKKIQKLANINVVNTFGSAGGLLGGLLGGALDVGGLVRGFFPGEGKKVGAAPQVGKPKTKPVIRNGKLRLGGIRALGVTNALFAGLDFTTGLAGGESIGKSAAGTSGALAGSLLGGAIGQALIPIPGVGFVIGSAAGSFLGGYGADRTYEAVESQRVIKAKQEAKLKEQSQAVERSKPGKVENQNNILDKFDDVANKFEGFVKGIVGGIAGAIISGFDTKDMPMEWGTEYPESSSKNNATGEYQDLEVSGGIDPSTVTKTSSYGMRWGKMHKGTDFGINSGTPISVIQPGVVEYSGWADGGAGNSVYINHPDGAKTVYFHLLNQSPLKNGQSITAGTFIGKVGMSGGTSTGPHLHFEYYPPGSNKQVDSEPYASKYFRFGGNVKVKPKAGGQSAPTFSGVENSKVPGNKSKLQSDVEGFRQFRNQKFGASKSRVATAGPQNFQIREMGIPGNKGYQINPLADDTNYEISEHRGAGHLENRAFDIPVPDAKSGDKVNQYWTSRGYKTLWRVKDHFDHVHVEIPRGKVQEFTKINSQSQVKTAPPKVPKVNQQLSYNQKQSSTLIIDRPSAVIATSGRSSTPTQAPVSTGGGGGTVVTASSGHQAERNTLNKLLELHLV